MIKYVDLQRINALCMPELQTALNSVAVSGWYLKGKATRNFEDDFAEYIGTRYCVGCGNGLDALTLIFRAYIEMGIMREGDEVIVPANTYIASVLAITENRLRPVFVEPSYDTLQIDDALIEQAVTPRTRAVLIVHLYGRCAYTDRIGDICSRYHLKLIEDNAQAHGCTFRSSHNRTGSLGDAAGHSFYPAKNLGALGDAGAITTDDSNLASMVEALGNYGSRQKYVFGYQGRNSRMDEVQAAVLKVKLQFLDAWNVRRKEIAALYNNKVKNPLILIPQSDRDSVWHIFPLFSAYRDELQRYLLENGVETQVHYPIPPHKQACYKEWNTLSLPVTELIHKQELSIPCHQAMDAAEVERIVGLLNDFTPR